MRSCGVLLLHTLEFVGRPQSVCTLLTPGLSLHSGDLISFNPSPASSPWGLAGRMTTDVADQEESGSRL